MNTNIKALADEAYLLLEKSDPATATQKAMQILKMSPDSPESFLLLAEVAEENEHYEHALTWVNNGLIHHQDHEGLLLKKASILIDGFEDIDEAFAILTHIKERFGNKSIDELRKEYDEEILLDIYLLLTDCYRLMGNFSLAFEHASIAHACVPNDEHAILSLASAQFELGNYEEALTLMEPVSSRTEAADFYWLKAQIKCAESNFLEADLAFVKANEIDKARYHLPPRLSQSSFFTCFDQALMELPDEIANFIDKASVQIKNVVAREEVKESRGVISPQACILTEKHEKGPLIIFLFQKNIENLSSNKKEISDVISSVLLHELSNFG